MSDVSILVRKFWSMFQKEDELVLSQIEFDPIFFISFSQISLVFTMQQSQCILQEETYLHQRLTVARLVVL